MNKFTTILSIALIFIFVNEKLLVNSTQLVALEFNDRGSLILMTVGTPQQLNKAETLKLLDGLKGGIK